MSKKIKFTTLVIVVLFVIMSTVAYMILSKDINNTVYTDIGQREMLENEE